MFVTSYAVGGNSVVMQLYYQSLLLAYFKHISKSYLIFKQRITSNK